MEQVPKNGWENKTDVFASDLASFLEEYSEDNRRGYDHLTELHFSGGTSGVMEQIADGQAPDEIQVLYENDQPTQLHAVYRVEGGQSTDVYLKGAALKDFLSD